MVAMQQEREKQSKERSAGAGTPEDEDDDEDFADYSAGESLLSLVQPEMVTLSKHWLAALKDHALLSLPTGGSTKRKFLLGSSVLSVVFWPSVSSQAL